MRDVTKYEVKGILDTKPKDLPEGLIVTEKTVEAPKATLNVRGERFEDSIHYKNGVYIRCSSQHFSQEETREIRDFLNLILGETGTRRIIFDQNDYTVHPNTPWRWYEMDNGLFIYAISLEDALKAHNNGPANMSYTHIVDNYGIHEETRI